MAGQRVRTPLRTVSTNGEEERESTKRESEVCWIVDVERTPIPHKILALDDTDHSPIGHPRALRDARALFYQDSQTLPAQLWRSGHAVLAGGS